MTDQERIEEIRKRVDAATPGPWVVEGIGSPNDARCRVRRVSGSGLFVAEYLHRWDAEFIAHARTDIPALLDLVATLRAKLAEAERWETGFRNIVTIVAGPRSVFNIPDIVEQVRSKAAALDIASAALTQARAEIEKWRKDYISIVDQGAEIEKRQAELLTEARAEAESLRAERTAIAREIGYRDDAPTGSVVQGVADLAADFFDSHREKVGHYMRAIMQESRAERAEAALREVMGLPFGTFADDFRKIARAYFTQQTKDTDQ